jgi:hypothetical protein
MTELSSEYRAKLRRKYRMDEKPQLNNAIVDRIVTGEQLRGRVFARNSVELFDPVRSPHMHERLMTTLSNLHTGIASGEIRRDTHDPDADGRRDRLGEPFNPDDPELLVYMVDTDTATVVRGPKRPGAFERATRNRLPHRRDVRYFAGMYQVMASLHDEFWDHPCNINVSRSCGGATQLMPYLAGTALLIFEICTPCLEYAEAAAATGHELSVMEAHMRVGLPFP